MAEVVQLNRSRFRFPGGDNRTTVLGATGTGKSTCGTWLLAHQRLDKRPWVIIDFKREVIFDHVGFPPIVEMKLDDRPPKKPGLYLVSPRPGQGEQLEDFLWRLWEKENVGIYVDEAALMPSGDAFPAILQQGRSKHIPVIACSQRPVNVARGLFSEASFFCVYRMLDKRDYKTIEGFTPADMGEPLPRYHWHWYDVERDTLLDMAPVPEPLTVAGMLNERAPYVAADWHPFAWTSRPSGRDQLKLV
jgi:hypothetical protein